jgi:hypothetical protein
MIIAAAVAVTAAYLPHFFDGCEFTSRSRYWKDMSEKNLIKMHQFYEKIGLKPSMSVKNVRSFKNHSQFIFACHPHGVFSFCHAMFYMNVKGAQELLAIVPASQRRALAARSLFSVPILRDIILWSGAVDASRAVAESCLKKGLSLTVLPGGEREQLLAGHNKHHMFIKNRKGFCRLAVKHNTPVVPCYCFGESSTYNTSSFLMGPRVWLSKTLFVSIPLPWGGHSWNPFVPHETHLTMCVADPIAPPPPDESLSDAEDLIRRVDLLHDQYIEAVVALFEENKKLYGAHDASLPGNSLSESCAGPSSCR